MVKASASVKACQSPLVLTTCRLACGMAKASMTAKRITKGSDEQAQGLDDGGVAQEGQDALDEHGHDDQDDLGRVARAGTPP